MVKDNRITELCPNIFLIRGEDTSSHSYLIRGDYKNLLIDSGVDKNFSRLQKFLLTLGLKVRDIDIVINTHEHFDHIGANRYFQDYALIAAHRFAATKITVEDRYVILCISQGTSTSRLLMSISGWKTGFVLIWEITDWKWCIHPDIVPVRSASMSLPGRSFLQGTLYSQEGHSPTSVSPAASVIISVPSAYWRQGG